MKPNSELFILHMHKTLAVTSHRLEEIEAALAQRLTDESDQSRFNIVTEVSEPPELTDADIKQIMKEARQASESMRKTIHAMENFTDEDLATRAR